jgi:TPR repeat protein
MLNESQLFHINGIMCRKKRKKMKKILLASLIAVTSTFSMAAPSSDKNPAFEQIEQLIKANDYTSAYQQLQKLAQEGNPQALYNLGYLTQVGRGVTKNEQQALKYYQQASEKGYVVADYVLANNYVTGGLGLPKDEKKAREYLEKASNAGFDDATVQLAVALFSENKPASDQQALKRLDPLIKKNSMPAIHTKALYDISTGIKNKQEAKVNQGLQSIQNLAKKGYIPALMAVGNMLANGTIVQQNLPEAQKIFSALAQQNVPRAKESLDTVNKMMTDQNKAKKS